MWDSRLIRHVAVFVIALVVLSGLVFMGSPNTLAFSSEQDPCPCNGPYYKKIYCCIAGSVRGGIAQCNTWCWIDYPGGPTATPRAWATRPPAQKTRDARTKTAVAAATETIEEQVPGCADQCDCRMGNGEGYCGGENEFRDCDDKYEWKHHNYDVVGSPAYDEWQQRVEKMVYGE